VPLGAVIQVQQERRQFSRERFATQQEHAVLRRARRQSCHGISGRHARVFLRVASILEFDDDRLQHLPDVASLAKSYVHAQWLIGRQRLAVPADDAPAEEWQQVFTQLGRPAESDGYDLAIPELLDAALQPDADSLDEFRHAAHGLGLLPGQVQGLFDWFLDRSGDQMAAMQARVVWGERTDANRVRALDFAHRVGGVDTTVWLGDTGLDWQPRLLSLLFEGARAGGEDVPGDIRAAPAVLVADGGRDGFVRDAGSARQEIARLQADGSFREAYTDVLHPAHEESVR